MEKPPQENGNSHQEPASNPEPDLPQATQTVPKRRSSYSNRGKRILSIGNGYVAKPHSEVSATEYYKLLDSSMPEPSQVRQLLGWCFRKKLEEDKESDSVSPEGETARGIAKIIKHELLKDLVDGTISTSWYSRKDEAQDNKLAGRRIIRPNPLNESNKENIEIFNQKLRQLKDEKQEWYDGFERCVAPLEGLTIKDTDADELELAKHVSSHGHIREDVIGEGLLEKLQSGADEAKQCVPEKLEESVDLLYHLLYQMGQTVKLVSKVEKDRLQTQVSKVVEKFMTRDNRSDVPTRHITVKELLRGISRLDSPASKLAR